MRSPSGSSTGPGATQSRGLRPAREGGRRVTTSVVMGSSRWRVISPGSRLVRAQAKSAFCKFRTCFWLMPKAPAMARVWCWPCWALAIRTSRSGRSVGAAPRIEFQASQSSSLAGASGARRLPRPWRRGSATWERSSRSSSRARPWSFVSLIILFRSKFAEWPADRDRRRFRAVIVPPMDLMRSRCWSSVRPTHGVDRRQSGSSMVGRVRVRMARPPTA